MFGSRIVIADKNEADRKNLKELLSRGGYRVLGEASDGPTAIKLIQTIEPDLAIVDINLPVLDGLHVARFIEESRITPVLMTASFGKKEILEKAKESWVFAYLIKPFTEENLFTSMEIAMASYQKIMKLEREVQQLKETLENRKIIEKAKGILMKNLGISESEAFKRMQQQSMKKRITMKALAEAIITANEIG